MPQRIRPRKEAVGSKGSIVERSFRSVWEQIFSSQAHLDSAFSRLEPEAKPEVAEWLPRVLRRPSLVFGGVDVWDVKEPMSLAEVAWHSRMKAQTETQEDAAGAFGLRADYPTWLTDEWERDWGVQTTERLARVLREDPDVHVRFRRDVPVPKFPFGRAGTLSPHAWCFDRFMELRTLDLDPSHFVIQDQGSQFLTWTALWPEVYAPLWSAAPGAKELARGTVPAPLPHFGKQVRSQVWIDVCAGAGGKTLALADGLENRGRVYAYDVSESRLQALRRRARTAGYTCIQTARVEEEGPPPEIAKREASAEGVWIDAPCSGWGVLRRTPDIKWRQTPYELEKLPQIQFQLLAAYAHLAKVGGRLVYSTCTFRRAETEAPVQKFLETPIGQKFRIEHQGYLGPNLDTDGFALTILRRER